ncbi:MAG: hypothetical protein J6L88_00100, partial [Clostridia bacterium]|nr:hypothetical protein [Clostridia bacterium]
TLDASNVAGQGNQISRASQQYYTNKTFTASNSDELNDVFKSIVDEIILQSRYLPTQIEDHHNYSGYITFTDHIGEYMNVEQIHGMLVGDTLFDGSSFASKFADEQSALAFFGTADNPSVIGDEFIFSVKERIGIDGPTARNLVSHAWQYGQLYYNSEDDFSNAMCWYIDADGSYLGFCDEEYDEPVPANAKYICRGYGFLDTTQVAGSTAQGNLLYCSVRTQTEITVQNGEVTEYGDTTLLWKIPASMIPMVAYEFTLENDSLDDPGKITMKSNVAEAYPIRLIYEVGLDETINESNVADLVDDSHIMPDGSYVFYTNQWDADALTDVGVNTTADFHPAEENERFHFTEDSPVYIKNDDGEYVLYTDTKAPSAQDATYYTRVAVFDWSDADDIKLTYNYIALAQATLDHVQYDEDIKDWYIPLGTHRNVVRYTATKSANNTETLDSYFYSPTSSSDGETHHRYTIMGNNGRLIYRPSQGLRIEKQVSVHVPGADPSFTFTVKRTDSDDDNGTYRYVHVNASGVSATGTITFTDSVAAFTLKDDEVAYIVDLPEDACYEVREGAYTGYTLTGISVDGSPKTGHITQDSTAQVTIAQHQLHEVLFTNAKDTSGALTIRKIVEHPNGSGYQVPEDLSFRFLVDLGTDYAGRTLDVYFSNIKTEKQYTVAADGTITINLVHDQSATLNNLDMDTTVTVTEIDLDAHKGFTVTPDASQTVVIPENAYASLTFTNTYDPADVDPVNLTVTGQKVLLGRDWQDGDTFTFVLEAHVVQGDEMVWSKIDEQTVTYDSTNADFDQISFSDAMSKQVYSTPGVYAYRLSEVEGSIGGIAYDPVVSYFDVVVGDADMDSKLEIQDVIGYRDITVTKPTAENPAYNVDVRYTNRYAAHGAASLDVNIEKVLEDRSGQNMTAEGFTFGLYNEDGTLVKASDATSAAGEATIRLVYDETDIGETYVYTLREIDGGVDGMTYDSTAYKLQVSIIDSLDGTICIQVKDEDGNLLSEDDGTDAEFEAQFRNIYDPKDVAFTLAGDKDLTGRAMAAGEFSFLLYETGADFVVAEDATPLQTAANSNAEGAFAFDTITKKEVGTYYYVVAEDDSAALGGVTYDQTRYHVTVVVEDHNGELKADVTITKQDGSEAALKFVNSYAPKAVEVTVNGSKVLNGATLEANAFTFALYNADSDFNTAGAAIRTAKNSANGTFAFPVIQIDQAGTYYFIAAEDDSDPIENILYDAQVYHLTLTAEDNGDGTLRTTLVIETAEGKAADEIVFTNTYTPPQEPPKEDPPAEEPKDDPPKTGDNMSVALWMLISATMIALLAAAAVLPRRARSK